MPQVAHQHRHWQQAESRLRPHPRWHPESRLRPHPRWRPESRLRPPILDGVQKVICSHAISRKVTCVYHWGQHPAAEASQT